ncbi:hypothetical protein ABZ260_10500 [Streptosporangium sp. NPDC006013]|uniref:hypothetical protein n=1 Tax=Streptosporangium sp. NPDC006013 TaxID=3155596 RepID=UPI0033A25FB4
MSLEVHFAGVREGRADTVGDRAAVGQAARGLFAEQPGGAPVDGARTGGSVRTA